VTHDQYVPHPNLDGVAPEAIGSMSRRPRSFPKRLRDLEEQAFRRARAFKTYADRFQVPTTLAQLYSERLSDSVKNELDKYCIDVLEPQKSSRIFSAQYFDTNNELLFCYMGERWRDVSTKVSRFVYQSNTSEFIC
jgi:hypothetical protein